MILRSTIEICWSVQFAMKLSNHANGHALCNDCIEKLNNCPICRNDSSLVRSLKLENIVQRLEGIPPENQEIFTAKRNLKKWGLRDNQWLHPSSSGAYGTINGYTQETRIEVNLQANPAPLNPPANNLWLCLSECCTVMFNEDNFERSIKGIQGLFVILACLVIYLYFYFNPPNGMDIDK